MSILSLPVRVDDGQQRRLVIRWQRGLATCGRCECRHGCYQCSYLAGRQCFAVRRFELLQLIGATGVPAGVLRFLVVIVPIFIAVFAATHDHGSYSYFIELIRSIKTWPSSSCESNCL